MTNTISLANSGVSDILRNAAYEKYVAHEFTPDQYAAVLEDIYLIDHK